MSYTVQITPRAGKALERLPRRDLTRIGRAIDRLAEQPRPRGCVRLAGSDELYRIRSGDYRIIYEIRARKLVVLAVRIGHRRDVYRGM